jgi:uncharacterized protein (DUF2164 family)
MAIELPKEQRTRAVASIERYFAENMDDRIGNIAAGALLGFFLEEIGPLVFNAAVQEAQQRLQERVTELDIEIHEQEFGYWPKIEQARAKARKK